MAFLNPGYGLILPFLFLFTIPIALLATLTTIIAFCILIFRVTLVYIELALTVIPHYILGSEPAAAAALTRANPPAAASHSRRKPRRTGSITPIPGGSGQTLAHHIRDYEGVGGWRLGPPSDDDDLWTRINSRLELPADHGRRHQRSLTSGSITAQRKSWSPEAMMRARTPPNVAVSGDSFFPQMPPSPGALRRSSSGLTGASLSSASSKASSVLSMKQR
jgi:hypothetical protein